MDRITIAQIQVRSRFTISAIRECQIKAGFGEHTRAKIVAEVKADQVSEVLTEVEKDKVEIISVGQDEEGGSIKKFLFSGMVYQVGVQEEGEYALLTLEAVSHSWKMDIRKKSRSFPAEQADLSGICAQPYGGRHFPGD